MAKSQIFMGKEETGFGDPLSDCSEFNIIQFINTDNDTPLDSPADPSRTTFQESALVNTISNTNNNSIIEGPWINNSASHQAQSNNNYGAIAAGHNGLLQTPIMIGNTPMYNNGTTRIMDSPPITDISTGGSSASPSTTSDSPYSPDYSQYGISQNGLMFNIPLVQPELIGQHQRMMHQPSPQPEFLSPYPRSTPSQMSQVSPPANNTFIINQPRFSNEIYQNDGSVISGNSMPAAKRPRTDSGMPIKTEVNQARLFNPDTLSTHGVIEDPYDENLISTRPIRVSGVYPADCDSLSSLQFLPHARETWADLFDAHMNPIKNLTVNVVADKGFNYSANDNCFVNQKKNHFQITVHIEVHDDCAPVYFRDKDGCRRISDVQLAFCGVKAEMPTNEVSIKQSTTDRKPVPHEPVSLEIQERRVTKVTVPRLHFSETTNNNNRKAGRPHPEQKYFLLVVKLIAYADDQSTALIQAYQSEKVIVRASNPAQFEQPEANSQWQCGANNVLHYNGQVAIGSEKPIGKAALTVVGDIALSGNINRPCDIRLKKDIIDVDTAQAMERVNKIRVVEFDYKHEIATQWGLDDQNSHRVGVVAQQVNEILPDAVRNNGEFLTVDDTRIFYETVAATQELYQLTGILDNKIGQVEKISVKLARLHKNKKMGSIASDLSGLTMFAKNDDGKSMSYSRTSLDSSATAYEGGLKSGKHRSCRSHCNRNDQALCSSKVTQGTIVTLVIVMALCLLAMCTLYVLDWYNRTYVYNTHIPIIAPTVNTDDGVANIITLTDGASWKPPIQPNAPILASSCELKGQCPQYCCAAKHPVPKSDGSQQFDGNLSPDKKPALLTTKTNHLAIPTSNSPFKNGLSIDIVNLNVTIDQRFCVLGSCRPRNGRYNLYIPISSFLPTIPLHVRFSVKDDRYVDNCGSLRDFHHKKCTFDFDPGNAEDSKEGPTSYMMGEGLFELSVGRFTQSAYRFRVGFTTESCNMNEDQQGRSFDEYNLVFYRTCLMDPTYNL